MPELTEGRKRRFTGLPACERGSAEEARRQAMRPEHWEAPTRRAKVHDTITALDMFSGAGGSSHGIEAAGIPVWYAANHWEYAVRIHEANNPHAEHFIADMVDTEASDYRNPENLPRAEVVWASPSCTNHSGASVSKAYDQGLSLFDVFEEDYEDRVTKSERSRATATCVLQYARKHHPLVIVVENVVEFAQWGERVNGTNKGDGKTFQWWLREFDRLGYKHRVLFLNSMFFPPTPQSRDRMYVCLWKKHLRDPDLDHRPQAICPRCETVCEAKQAFKPRKRSWPLAEWGKYDAQYQYICPSCLKPVKPFAMPALTAIDWSDLGQRIGDRKDKMAETTYARLQRGAELLKQWPSFLMPAKAMYGVERTTAEPMVTQTTQQTAMLVQAFQLVAAGHTFEREGSNCRLRSIVDQMWSQHTSEAFAVCTAPPSVVIKNNGDMSEAKYRAKLTTEPIGAITSEDSKGVMVAPFIDNVQGVPRSPVEQFPVQGCSETMGLMALIVPNRTNGIPRPVSEPTVTFTTQHNSHQLVSAPLIYTNRSTHEGRAADLRHVSDPMSAVTAAGNHHWLVSPIFAKQNGGPADTAWHQAAIDPLNTATGIDTTALVLPPNGEMPPIDIDDCFYRMLKPPEIQLGMAFPQDFKMWGAARDKVKALGNAVTPPVAEWLMGRMVAILA